MDNNAIKLCEDYVRGNLPETFSDKAKNREAIRQVFIEANGGSDKLDYKSFRNNPELFTIVETVLPIIINEGLKGDEFFMQFVEYVNLKLGDEQHFLMERPQEIIISNATYGTKGIKRQRLQAKDTLTVQTQLRVAAVYEELKRLMAGRTNFDEFIDAIKTAFVRKIREDIYLAFKEYTSSVDKLGGKYVLTGSYVEDKVVDLIDKIESRNEQKAIIVGTRKALRKLRMDVFADEAKSDMYNLGYYGKFNGTSSFVVPQRHKIGSEEFIFPDNMIWVIAGEDKFIKVVDKGEGLLSLDNPLQNGDHTQNYFYGQEFGVALVAGGYKIGSARFDA